MAFTKPQLAIRYKRSTYSIQHTSYTTHSKKIKKIFQAPSLYKGSWCPDCDLLGNTIYI